MRRYLHGGLLAAALTLSGCTHSVHVNHTSDYRLTKPLADYLVVEARSEQNVFMGFVANTTYADEAFSNLQAQCPKGQVTGIQTRYSTSHGFLSWKNVILMKGYCSE